MADGSAIEPTGERGARALTRCTAREWPAHEIDVHGSSLADEPEDVRKRHRELTAHRHEQRPPNARNLEQQFDRP